jgi:hypothetical protein
MSAASPINQGRAWGEEAKTMKSLLFVLILLVAGVAALGWYRGWFTVSTGTDEVNVKMNKEQLKDDEEKAKAKLEGLKDQIKDKANEPKKETPPKVTGDPAVRPGTGTSVAVCRLPRVVSDPGATEVVAARSVPAAPVRNRAGNQAFRHTNLQDKSREKYAGEFLSSPKMGNHFARCLAHRVRSAVFPPKEFVRRTLLVQRADLGGARPRRRRVDPAGPLRPCVRAKAS